MDQASVSTEPGSEIGPVNCGKLLNCTEFMKYVVQIVNKERRSLKKIIIIIIIIILYRNLNNVMNRPLPFIFGHRVAWIGKSVKFQYTNDTSFGHVWPRTKGVRLTNFGSPVYNRSSQ